MSGESNFPFVEDDILRKNLDIAFDHIIELTSLSESPAYSDILKSSFRKTTIIYTASIVEALLLLLLKKQKTEEQLARRNEVFEVTKEIYDVNESERIALGKTVHRVEKFRFDKVNLDQINLLCRDHSLITKDIYQDVDRIRKLRNRLHIGTLTNIEEDYTKQDLEFVFSVARVIKNLARKVV